MYIHFLSHLRQTIPDFSAVGDLNPNERQFIDDKSVSNQLVTFLDHISPISEDEKSVLITDLYLLRPTQHKIFGENREPGLTDSLFETNKISDITNTIIAPNVDLITVGKKTPEPVTVLDSKRLNQLIDGIVIVSRFDVTTKKELTFTLDGLQHLNADVLGIVLNAFDPKRSTDYYTNYAYYKRTYSEYYQEDKL